VDPTHGQGESRHPQVRGPVGDWSAPFIGPEAAATITAATIAAAAAETGVTEAAFAAATAWIVGAGAAISVASATAAAIGTAITTIAAAVLGQGRDGEEDGRRQRCAGKKEEGEEGAEEHRSGLFRKDKRMLLKIRKSV
jgi:hypothetical protein